MTRGIAPYCKGKGCWYSRMKRAYIRVINPKTRKQELLPIGWFCEQCGTFKADEQKREEE